jgi:dUTP pyrophosphatase
MLFVQKLDASAIVPTVSHEGADLAYDVYALETIILMPGIVNKVRTGIAVSHDHLVNGHVVPDGQLIRDRSSMASKGVFTHGGVIDAGYRGEVMVLLTTLTKQVIKAGDKFAQMVPTPVLTDKVVVVEKLTTYGAERGDKGFGSTGQ